MANIVYALCVVALICLLLVAVLPVYKFIPIMIILMMMMMTMTVTMMIVFIIIILLLIYFFIIVSNYC